MKRTGACNFISTELCEQDCLVLGSFLVVLEARSTTEIVNCGSMLYSMRCGGACKQFFVALPFRNHMRRGGKNVAWKEFQDLAPFFIRLTAHNP